MKTRTLLTAALVALGITAATLTGSPASASTTAPIVAVAGDSTTARPDSWRAQTKMIAPDAVTFRGGYAKSGATSAEILAAITPAAFADYGTVRVGTNDWKTSRTTTATLANVVKIVAKLDVEHPILVAVAPCDIRAYGPTRIDRQALGMKFNAELKALAAERGWLYVDLSASFRSPFGGYLAGMSDDGIHPTPEAARLEARAFLDLIASVN